MRVAQKTRVGAGQVVWFAYEDGVMLRDKRGVGRRFKSEKAALTAPSLTTPPVYGAGNRWR